MTVKVTGLRTSMETTSAHFCEGFLWLETQTEMKGVSEQAEQQGSKVYTTTPSRHFFLATETRIIAKLLMIYHTYLMVAARHVGLCYTQTGTV